MRRFGERNAGRVAAGRAMDASAEKLGTKPISRKLNNNWRLAGRFAAPWRDSNRGGEAFLDPRLAGLDFFKVL
jgi:hypothetical protein